MNQNKVRLNRINRKVRVRHNVLGDTIRPRLHVFRSNRYIYAQIINDEIGKTLVAATEKEIDLQGTKSARSIAIGQLIAAKAKKAKITKVRFDRGYYKFHGRVEAVAKAAREAGLEF